MAEEMGFQDICVERDALTVIRKLIAAVEDRSCIEVSAVADAQWDFVYSVKEKWDFRP
ncbi:hypothetical protein Goarm_018682, partial [Gossypium armourianum]|nr:hypothetical protein [Gossypium armourianum]